MEAQSEAYHRAAEELEKAILLAEKARQSSGVLADDLSFTLSEVEHYNEETLRIFQESCEVLERMGEEGNVQARESLKEIMGKQDGVNGRVRQTLHYGNRLLQRLEQRETQQDCQSELMSTSSVPASLPKLELPRFSGKAVEFRPFWDQFQVWVHDREFAEIDKFAYLKMCLLGEARDCIGSLPLMAANYRVAIERLKQRFGDPSSLLRALVGRLFSIPRAREEGQNALRGIFDEFESCLDEVVSLITEVTAELPPSEAGSRVASFLLAPLLLDKLPPSTLMEWNRRKVKPIDRYDLAALREFVRGEIQARGEAQLGSGRVARPLSPKYKAASSRGEWKGKTTVMAVEQNNDVKDVIRAMAVKERRNYVRKNNVCYLCLRRGHAVKFCNSSQRCQHCKGRHHTLLHEERRQRDAGSLMAESSSSVGVSAPLNAEAEPFTVSQMEGGDSRVARAPTLLVGRGRGAHGNTPIGEDLGGNGVVLQTALIRAYPAKGGPPILARLLLDTGSQESYITRHLTRQLGVPVVAKRVFATEGLGGIQTPPRSHSQVSVTVKSRHNDQPLALKFWEVDRICSPLPRGGFDPKALAATPLADSYSGSSLRVDGLLGMDLLPSILLEESPSRAPCGLCLLPTIFGYVAFGRIKRLGPTSTVRAYLGIQGDNPWNPDNIGRLWSLEGMGISPQEEDKVPLEPPAFRDGRYEVAIPWKSDGRPAPNYGMARKRLESYFRMPPQRRSLYDKVFKEWRQEGVLELAGGCATVGEDFKEDGYFIPHHGVSKGQDKIRVGLDGAAISPNGLSINACIEAGPNLMQNLLGIILGFRIHQFVLIADVKAAFLQNAIRREDRKFLRCMWNEDGVIQYGQFTRVPLGLTCSPYLLQLVIQSHLQRKEEEFPLVVHKLRQSLYVDDLVVGADSPEELREFQEGVISLLEGANMQLHKWRTTASTADLCPDRGLRDNGTVLGITWEEKKDVTVLDLGKGTPQLVRSKRDLLRWTASIFDPLGVAFPVVIHLRICLQQLWKGKKDWDEEISGDVLQEIEGIARQLRDFPPVQIRRYVGRLECLHAFVDASPLAYAAAIYGSGPEGSLLLWAKARVAPLKPILTLPRLELMGALLGSRMYRFLVGARPQLEKLPIFFWSDSSIALAWIRGEPSRWKQFVRNRVVEIGGNCPISSWHHIRGTNNPADCATRGISVEEWVASSLWWQGPSIISQEGRPEREGSPLDSRELALMQKEECKSTILMSKVVNGVPVLCIDVNRFSELSRAVKVVAYCSRFISNCRGRVRQLGQVGPLEREEAMDLLLRTEQWKHNPQEVSALSQGEVVEKRWGTHKLSWDRKRLLMLCQHRTGENALPYLPRSSGLGALIIRDCHKRAAHQGWEVTLNAVRALYWRPALRSAVRKETYACIVCRKVQGRPFRTTEGELPPFRREEARPFEHVGIDYCGPFYLRAQEKGYILLFTCAVTRAVHLEVTPSMSEGDTLRAFQRFIARRGYTTRVYSDNGKSFRALSAALKGTVEWKTIPEGAPWWGGFYERMVGTVKRALKKVLGRSLAPYEHFLTVVTEIEGAINRRPLQGTNPEDPLTPGHFLFGCRPPELGNPRVHEALSHEPSRWGVDKFWQHRIQISRHLWQWWRQEYLVSLRQWSQSRAARPNMEPQTGQVVLVHEANAPRGRWALARIVELIHGRDGPARAAQILLKGRLTRRPLARLYPLETGPTPLNSPHSDPDDATIIPDNGQR